MCTQTFKRSHGASFIWGFSFTAWIPELVVGTVLRLQELVRAIFPLTAATCDGWDCNDAMIHFVFHFSCFFQLSLCGSWPDASLENMPQIQVSVSQLNGVMKWFLDGCFLMVLVNYYTVISQDIESTWWFYCCVGQVSVWALWPVCGRAARHAATSDAWSFLKSQKCVSVRSAQMLPEDL